MPKKAKSKKKKSDFMKGVEESLKTPYVKKTMIKLGKGEGRAYKFMTKIREGRVSDKEEVEFIKREYGKSEKAEKKRKLTIKD